MILISLKKYLDPNWGYDTYKSIKYLDPNWGYATYKSIKYLDPNWGYDTYKSIKYLLTKSPDPPSKPEAKGAIAPGTAGQRHCRGGVWNSGSTLGYGVFCGSRV